ncbi:MAG: hypothetical protein SPJ34_08455 [Candidatus Ornithospirochaeta sp.]|nr:hypothetical protein [Candidatus Ornithospirochaeta sp.]
MADNEKLECLKNLQDVLQRKFEYERQVADLPSNLKAEEEKLIKANERCLELSDKFNTVNEEVKSLSIRYDDATHTRDTYEKQMEYLNTQREYEALSKQLDAAKTLQKTLLEQRNAKTTALDKLRAELEEQESICDSFKARVDEEKGKVEVVLNEINKEIEVLDSQCNEIRNSVISDDLYSKFSNIVKKKKGLGIVPVHGQVCMGCDRVLPMQFVIDMRLKQLDNEIEYCPYCSRIIYYEKLDDEIEKNYIFEQLEPTKASDGSKATAIEDNQSKTDSESFDESMEMGGDFEDF